MSVTVTALQLEGRRRRKGSLPLIIGPVYHGLLAKQMIEKHDKERGVALCKARCRHHSGVSRGQVPRGPSPVRCCGDKAGTASFHKWPCWAARSATLPSFQLCGSEGGAPRETSGYGGLLVSEAFGQGTRVCPAAKMTKARATPLAAQSPMQPHGSHRPSASSDKELSLPLCLNQGSRVKAGERRGEDSCNEEMFQECLQIIVLDQLLVVPPSPPEAPFAENIFL